MTDITPEGEHKLSQGAFYASEAEQLSTDLLMTGNAYTVDGKRVPPEDVAVYRHDGRRLMNAAVGYEVNKLERWLDADARYPLHGTQEALDHLAENIAGMLDEAMHLEACWISEDETRCVCIISQLRAVLPQCGHVESVGVKGRTRQCLSTVHPSAPYKHVFGTV